MSIIYEALKKAENEIKDQDRGAQPPQEQAAFVEAYKKMEAKQKSAIHERLKTSIVPEHEHTNSAMLKTMVIMTVLFAVAGVAFYHLYLRDSFFSQGLIQTPVTSTSQSAAERALQRDVVVMPPQVERAGRVRRDVVVQPVVSEQRETTAISLTDTRHTYFDPRTGKPIFVVSGVIIEPTERYCFLNGAIMRVGESLNGANIVAIEDRKVVLKYQGKTITLLLPASKQKNDHP
jgi:type II secretory pathway component PulC